MRYCGAETRHNYYCSGSTEACSSIVVIVVFSYRVLLVLGHNLKNKSDGYLRSDWTDSNLKQLASLGLLGDEAGYKKALKDANRQSIFQGLLNTGLSYIAQPKTGNYGTVLPYVAKAGIAGIGAAQKPFDKLASNAMTNAQLKALLDKQNESIFAKESVSPLLLFAPGRVIIAQCGVHKQTSSINTASGKSSKGSKTRTSSPQFCKAYT